MVSPHFSRQLHRKASLRLQNGTLSTSMFPEDCSTASATTSRRWDHVFIFTWTQAILNHVLYIDGAMYIYIYILDIYQ